MVTDSPLRLRVSQQQRDARLAICRACTEHFAPATQQCRLCWCVMPLKTYLRGAACPAGKWEAGG